MVLPVVKYGHPALRKRGAVIKEITSDIQQLIQNMLETMVEARGIGLAAQQVGQALQLFVVDVREVDDRPSRLEIDNQEVPVGEHMPMVLINPKLSPLGELVAGPEGCLSFPEIYLEIQRSESVGAEALNQAGETVHFRCGGLLSRVIQHENDHLRGVLFIDRVSTIQKDEVRPQLQALQAATKAELQLT